jgi:hypothetical protein
MRPIESCKAHPIFSKSHTSTALMPVQTHLKQQSTIRLLGSGILAVGILCLLAWSLGSHTGHAGNDSGRSGFAVSMHMPLQANSEYSFALKRFFNRDKDQPKSVEPSDPIWATSGEVIASLRLVAANLHNPTTHSPHIRPHQLQTLNVPRAPPLA